MSSRRERAAARRQRNQEIDQGSLPLSEPDFLLVGILRRPHGVNGEVLMAVMTDFPERLAPGVTLYLGDKRQALTIASIRHHNKGKLIKFKEFNYRDEIEGLQNQGLFVPTADRPPLPEGEYYWHQMRGLTVVTDEGQTLGILADMIETGANPVYVVRPEEGKDILLPAIDDVILNIDMGDKKMTVHVLDGLLDLYS